MAKVNLALCWVEMKKKFKKNAYAVLKEINAQNGNSRFLKKETLEKTKSILLFFNDELVRFVLESGLEGPYYFIAMTNKKAFIDEIRQYKLHQVGDIEAEEHSQTNVHNKRQRAHENGTMSAKKYKNGVTFEEDNDEEEDQRNIEEEDDEEEENEDEDDEYSDDNDEYEDDDDDDEISEEEEEQNDENEEEGVGANSSDLEYHKV
jgi:Mg-chelatase subunit ChlI